jgi:hypothetical protein
MAEEDKEWISNLVRNNSALRFALNEEKLKRTQAEVRMKELEEELNRAKNLLATEQKRYKESTKILLENIEKGILKESSIPNNEIIYHGEIDPVYEETRKKLQNKLRISVKDVDEAFFVQKEEIIRLKIQLSNVSKKFAQSKSKWASEKVLLQEDIQELTNLLVKKTSYCENLISENDLLKSQLQKCSDIEIQSSRILEESEKQKSLALKNDMLETDLTNIKRFLDKK